MQTLYRKYRPKTFDEVEGQEHVVRTLEGALLSGRAGHAYLFCGPRGTGKTTLARLFAKALNCVNRKGVEPCNKCQSCQEINDGRSLDLIEIDAASNRGIDEIRNVKESARVAASASTYKIFIIDEVHMLTPPAFNALLKTLEEPPAHIVFILATTEPHKVLETILSRVQRFDFKKISGDKIIKKLERISRTEKLNIEKEALVSVAAAAAGSLRDAESSLSKLIAFTGDSGPITAAAAMEILGVVPIRIHEKLFDSIISKNKEDALAEVAAIHESGVDLENFTKQFLHYLRATLLDVVGSPSAPLARLDSSRLAGKLDPAQVVKIINAFTDARRELKNAPIPQLPLELAILELTNG